MARDYPSSVDKLPLDVQQAILAKRARGATIDQIKAAIAAIDPEAGEISRSALARHIKSEAAVIQQMRLMNSITVAVKQQMGDKPDDELAQANLELLKGHILRLLTATTEDAEGNIVQREFTPKEVRDLSTSLKDNVATKKLEAEWRAKVRAEYAAEAANAVKKAATSEGISADVAQRLWDAVMGTAT